MHAFFGIGHGFRQQSLCFLLTILVFGFFQSRAILCFGQDKTQSPKQVWIYRDAPTEEDRRSETERLFEPYGIMPAERATRVAVNVASPVDPKDASKGTAVEVLCAIDKLTDWEGTYWLLENGTAWGSHKGINVQDLLGVGPDTRIALRFRAWGEGNVSFKCGGVNTGRFASSLRLPLELPGSPVTLSEEPKEYTIGPIPARQLTNIIDPMCVVTSGLDNRGLKEIRIYVDDVRFERFEQPAEDRSSGIDWRQRLQETLFVSYTPSGFDPTAKPVKRPTQDDIRKDLEAIRILAANAGIPADRVGITTYGCDNGLEQIAPIAGETGIAVLLGIFSPRNEDEVANATAILQDPQLKGAIAGVVVGNECVTFRRATLDDIEAVIQQLRQVRSDVPYTTTEIVQAYGNKRLFTICDFTSVNAHALFSSVFTAEDGARWAIQQIDAVREAAPQGHLILAKEVGWPAGPKPFFSTEQQRVYWRAILRSSVARDVNICFFDGLNNVTWKNEPIEIPAQENQKVNVGPHWPVLFDADRRPKEIAPELLSIWKETRSSK